MFGTKTISTTGRSLRVSADGKPIYKAGGMTVDWSTVTAVNADTTLADGTIVKAGEKYLRYGTVMARITASGKFGPYLSTASDGRQTLRRGDCYLLDTTVVNSPNAQVGQLHVEDRGGIEGGLVFLSRILGASGVAGNPAEADLSIAFPALQYVRD